jgi:type VI secretion system protein ImpC
MPRSSSLASVHFDVAEDPQPAARPEPDMPFRILVAGNFSGGAGRLRKPVEIDRDNFDEVLSLFAPEIALEFAGTSVPVRFRELDDFHPDSLFRRLPPFQALRDLRERVAGGQPFPDAAPPPNMSGADLLRGMLGDTAAGAGARPAAPPRGTWDQMLHELVAPYAEPKPDPRRPHYLAQTDAAIAGEMRGVFHNPAFQDLEAAWRGLYFLVRRLETGENLKVYAWDMPQARLATAEGQTALRRVAVEEAAATPGAPTWSVVAGLCYFGPPEETALAQIGAICRRAGAPFLSGLAPEVVGLTRAFDALRQSSVAPWIGLAMPRFLLRLPYGAKTGSTEEFAFEEMPSPPEHERYLWGHPAFACAYLLGEAFSRYGWEMRPGVINSIDGLPAHVYDDGGEPSLKPCAEVLLTEEAVDMLLECGFMPLVSIKGSDRVRLARFQSVADPLAPLAGQWG